MTTTYYTILQTEHGQALQCARCGLISYNENDVAQRYCANCKIFFADLTDPRGALWAPLTLAEMQTVYNRLWRFLRTEQAMRENVFPAGHPKRMGKLTASAQALADLVTLKDILKNQFAIQLADTIQTPTTAAEQPPLLDVPSKTTYH